MYIATFGIHTRTHALKVGVALHNHKLLDSIKFGTLISESYAIFVHHTCLQRGSWRYYAHVAMRDCFEFWAFKVRAQGATFDLAAKIQILRVSHVYHGCLFYLRIKSFLRTLHTHHSMRDTTKARHLPRGCHQLLLFCSKYSHGFK